MADVTPARRCAFNVVRRVLAQGAYADRAFRAEADRFELDGRDRALAMQIAYGTIQRRSTLAYVAERLTGRPIDRLDARVRAALTMGLYQIAFLGGIADHAAVSESVELAKSRGGGHRLVNAALRRATHEARAIIERLDDATVEEAALKHSHPLWVAELWFEMLGRDHALALMERDNEPAESSVRANTLRMQPDELVAALASEAVRARLDTLAPEAVVLEDPYDVHGSRLFKQGALMPQSRASMLVSRMLDPQPGDAVLDLCAAPGAKTSHIAALMGDEGRVVAVDLEPRRASAIEANCERLGVGSVEVRIADAAELKESASYDRVLVDPPCSDLGTLQSRPDARWRKRPGQVTKLRALQSRILETGARALRPGGRLVYSTCTIDEGENAGQVRDFLERHQDYRVVDLSESYPEVTGTVGGGFVQTLPHRDGTDGFFIAALERGTA
jgi:16S rRNA (cytosine967-C5)-methyltransferase